jgi:dihydrofolate reductase
LGKLILFMVVSLDGFVGGPNGQLDWEVRDPEVGAELVPEFQRTVKTIVIGRVLYQGFQKAWPAMAADPKSPKELVDFAHWLEDTPKVVFSTTLTTLAWGNSRLYSPKGDADIVRKISEMKHSDSGDIVVFGGARLAQTLARLGLVDEYQLKIQPIALGAGLRLFEDLPGRAKFKLLRSKAFPSGVLGAYYGPA